MMQKMDAMPHPAWAYYFNVDGIDAAAHRITDAGGKIAIGPLEVPGGEWILNAFDPQGGYFCLLSNAK
jgi:predicted enzyme related to lactoylglutathione lyase